MSLDKSVKYGKEKREEFRGSKRFDMTCRNNGSCKHCQRNRTFSKLKLSEIDKLIEEDDFSNEVDFDIK